MNLEHIITNSTGLVHTIASTIALISGAYILLAKKGTSIHKKIGYIYVIAMIIVLITSFMIYNLFDGFGIFHAMAIVSVITLVAGMFPIVLKRPKSYISLHYNFMYWSVIGLYGAFMAEIFTRIPRVVIQDKTILPIFFNMVGIAVFIVMALGYYFMRRNRANWEKFDSEIQNKRS